MLFYRKGYSSLFEFYYTKADTDSLLADKVSNIGNVTLPGHLDIGTTYTNSRVICNAEVCGCTGYAEIYAAGSYDLFLNSQTTYPNGGWMYFKVNNDDYMQSSGIDNQVNMYKDTATSDNLDVGSGASPKINVHVANNGYTGYAGYMARSSYDMLLNLQTARVNGGWMFSKINNDNFLLLSCSGQFAKYFKPSVAQSDDKLKETTK